jgi:hypothetical protein
MCLGKTWAAQVHISSSQPLRYKSSWQADAGKKSKLLLANSSEHKRDLDSENQIIAVSNLIFTRLGNHDTKDQYLYLVKCQSTNY